jgi:hypothetical protein
MAEVMTERTIEIPLLTYGSEGKPSKATAKIDIPDSLGILDHDEPVPQDCGMFSILTEADGDKRVVWNTLSIPEINDAKEMFNNLIAKGMTAFAVGLDGQQTSRELKFFEATAGEVVFAPARALRAG